MAIPPWIFFLVAVWVVAFGVYRIVVAVKRSRAANEPDRPNFRKRGLYGQSPRTHVLFGIVYVLLGGCLVAMGLGWQPGSGCLGDRAVPTVEPDKTGTPGG